MKSYPMRVDTVGSITYGQGCEQLYGQLFLYTPTREGKVRPARRSQYPARHRQYPIRRRYSTLSGGCRLH